MGLVASDFKLNCGTYIVNCTGSFQGRLTDVRTVGDYTIFEVDGAIEVVDVSDKVRRKALKQFEPQHHKYGMQALGMFAVFYFISQVTSATLDQTILNVSHRKLFATAALVVCVVNASYFLKEYLGGNKERYGEVFINENRLLVAQDARRRAREEPSHFFSRFNSQNFEYFHDGELLKLIVLAHDREIHESDLEYGFEDLLDFTQKRTLNLDEGEADENEGTSDSADVTEEKEDDFFSTKRIKLTTLNQIILNKELKNRLVVDHSKFWNKILKKWEALEITKETKESAEIWDKVKLIIERIAKKAKALRERDS